MIFYFGACSSQSTGLLYDRKWFVCRAEDCCVDENHVGRITKRWMGTVVHRKQTKCGYAEMCAEEGEWSLAPTWSCSLYITRHNKREVERSYSLLIRNESHRECRLKPRAGRYDLSTVVIC